MKHAILFIGLPASGKSTYIDEHINKRFYWIVDADSIKELHVDYDSKHPEIVHQWSVKEAERLMNEYSDVGVPICMDSGGVNKHYSVRIIEMLKSKGYTVELIHMDTPVDICIERNKNRDRSVPETVIIEKSQNIDSCVEKQKQLVDNYKKIVWDTKN